MVDISSILVNEYIFPEILGYFTLSDIDNCRLVSHKWKDAVDTIIKNNSKTFHHLLRELDKGDWFNRNELKITKLERSFPIPYDSSQTLRLTPSPAINRSSMTFHRFLMDSKFIYAVGFIGVSGSGHATYLLKFDIQTGKMTEIEPSKFLRVIAVCGNFILQGKSDGSWALSNKNDLKLNGRNCQVYKSIENQLNKMEEIIFKSNKYGIWTINDNGNELQVFLLSDIQQGFQLKRILEKNMDGDKNRNWMLEKVIGMRNGFFCFMGDDEKEDFNQYLFVSLPEVEVSARIISEDLEIDMDAPVNMSSRVQNENIIVFQAKGHYLLYNQEGKEFMKIPKKISSRSFWVWLDACEGNIFSRYYILEEFKIKNENNTPQKYMILDTKRGTTFTTTEHQKFFPNFIGSNLIFLKRPGVLNFHDLESQKEGPVDAKLPEISNLLPLDCEEDSIKKFIYCSSDTRGSNIVLVSSLSKKYLMS